jgi:hypothetical protein
MQTDDVTRDRAASSSRAALLDEHDDDAARRALGHAAKLRVVQPGSTSPFRSCRDGNLLEREAAGLPPFLTRGRSCQCVADVLDVPLECNL